MEVLPMQDENVLSHFRDFSQSLKKIDELYGSLPRRDDEAMQLLHDRTVAESFKIANALGDYAVKQEKNAVQIHNQSRSASPKGAARINAQANAQILHSLNQLIKINGQMLKLQGENFALQNMNSKSSSESFNKSRDDLKGSMNKFKPRSNFPKF
jgi:hypothetical protein